MTVKEMFHWIIGGALNLFVIVLLIRTAWSGNDKAIILVIVLYPALVIVNLLAWLVLKAFGIKEASIYKTLLFCLIILFFPVMFIAALY